MKLYKSIILLPLILNAYLSKSANYYVNDGSLVGDVYTFAVGNDANPGTALLPKATVQNVIGSFALTSGDTIFVDAGTYLQTIDATGLAGASGNPIVFTGADSSLTIFENNNLGLFPSLLLSNTRNTVWEDMRFDITSVDGNGINIYDNSDSNEVRFCRINNGYYGVDILTLDTGLIPNYNLIHNNHIEAQYVGVRIKAQRSQFSFINWLNADNYGPRFNEVYENNIVNRGTAGGTSFSTIELHAIQDNDIYRNVAVMDVGVDGWGVIFLAHGVTNNNVVNNYLINLSDIGVLNHGIRIDDNFDYDMNFEHNSIYSRKTTFYAPTGGQNFEFTNNILYSATEDNIDFNGTNQTLGVSMNNHFYYPNGNLASTMVPITTIAQWQAYNPDGTNNAANSIGGNAAGNDPLFTDPFVWNLDLLCLSPSMDAAYYNIPSINVDIHGTARPWGIRKDIGAFEGQLVEAGNINPDFTRLCTGDSLNLLVSGMIAPSATWQESTDGVTWGATSGSITVLNDTVAWFTHTNVSATPDTFYYRTEVNGTCNDDWTDTAMIIVDPMPNAGNPITGGAICVGGNHLFTVSGHIGDSIYWQSRPGAGGSWTDAGSTVNPLNITANTDTTFRAVVKWSNQVCPADTTNDATVTVSTSTPSVTMVLSNTPTCPGDNAIFDVTDSTGAGINPSFAWFVNGGSVGTDNFQFSSTTLNDGDSISVIITSSDACANPTTDTASVTINLNPTSVPSVSLMVSQNPICVGDNVIFTVTDSTGAGNDPSFAWFINGGAVGTDNFTFSSSTLNNNDSVSVIITSNAICPTPVTDTANITMSVTTSIAPNVSMSASQNPICDGDNVVFTVTDSSGGGANPSFAWFINGSTVGTDSYTFNSSTLNDNDSISVVITSNASCPSPLTDTASITMAVTPLQVPNVTMSADANPVCAGTNITFTVTDSSGAGSNPSFGWYVNGVSVGADNNNYSSAALNDGDSVSVIITSNATCPSPSTDTANITVSINPLSTPNVSMVASSNPICAGDNVVFTVSDSTGAGNDPSFSWYVNGGAVGTDRYTYNSSSLVNGDSVSVIIASNAVCPSPTTDTANITMIVTSSVVPNVAMSPDNNPICAGDNVTFTVTDSSGGGSNPSFQWFIDGAPVAGDQNNYSSIAIADGNVVSVIMTSNSACASPLTDTAFVTMTVSPGVGPSVSITGLPNPICQGDNVTFTVVDSSNAGTDPSFAWFINGVPTATDNYTFSSTSINDGDSVSVTITSNAACASPLTNSTYVLMNVNPLVSPNVSVSAPNPVCPGDNVTISVTDSSNAGTDPTFAWYINGMLVAGDQNSFSSISLNDNDSVSVIITSNSACPGDITDTANVTMSVGSPIVPVVTIAAGSPQICLGDNLTVSVTDSSGGGSNPTFSWTVNGIPTGGDVSSISSTSFGNGDIVEVTMTSNLSCASPLTDVTNVTLTVNPLVTPTVQITSNGTVCEGDLATFDLLSQTNEGAAPTYEWFVNGNPTGNTTTSYSSNILNDGDAVTLSMTSNVDCPLPATVSDVTFAAIDPCDCDSIFIPNAISPNNDNANDSWQIAGLDCFDFHEVRVYNRYGSLVYSSTDYINPWDGYRNGQPMPVAVYYYVVDIRDSKSGYKNYTGTLTIMR